MYIISFNAVNYNTLCLYFYIHYSFLICYTCISEFFVPLKCSICFCFIACHNSLSSPVCIPSSTFFSLCIWQPFIWSCIPTYDLWLVFPRVLFKFFSTFARKNTLSQSHPHLFRFFLFETFPGTSERHS